MTRSSSVGLIVRCDITPRYSSKVSSEDKLMSVVTLMQGDMVGRTGDASPVSPAVATPLWMIINEMKFLELFSPAARLCWRAAGGGVQNVNMATLSAIPASKVVCSGDALKSCTMGQENQATIDVQSAGPGLLQ